MLKWSRIVAECAPSCGTVGLMSTMLWFRRDLRLVDNPALDAAVAAGDAVVPLFIFAPQEERHWQPGGASRWWLHGSLARLGEEFAGLGSRLIVRRAADTLAELKAVAAGGKGTRGVGNQHY